MPTKSNQKSWNLPLRTRRYQDAVWQPQVSTNIVSTNVTDTVTTGENLPDWRRRIANRESATTSLSGTKYYVRGSSNGGSVRYQRSITSGGVVTRIGSTASGLVAGTPSMAVFGSVSLSQTSANNQALNRFVTKVADAKREVQSLVTLGELGENLRFVRQRSQTLYNGFWAYLDELKKRSRGLKRSRLVQQMIAETWLELQLVIKPTIGDIQDAARAAAKIASNHFPSRRVSGSAITDRWVSLTGHNHELSNHWRLWKTAQQYQTVSIRYTGSVSAPSKTAYGNLEALGATPGDVWGSIWELLPWSFVADYFTNIQEIIESLRFHTADLDWCEKGVKIVQTARCTDVRLEPIVPAGWKLDWAYCDPGTKLTLKKVSVTRSAYTGSLTPSLEFEIPGLSLKWLNLLALNRARTSVSRRLSSIG